MRLPQNTSIASPFNFNEDFQKYTKALYALKAKYPEVYMLLHEHASSLICAYDATEEAISGTTSH